MIKKIEIEIGEKVKEIALVAVYSDKYILSEIVNGEMESRKFWLQKRIEGLPSIEQAEEEIKQEFLKLKR